MSITTFPLHWPQGWPRAKFAKSANFGTKEQRYGTDGATTYKAKADMTMAEAMKRVHYELDRLGVNVADDSIVSTNLKLNLSGLPRGDQGEPSDRGVAVYWQKKNGPMRVIAIDVYDRVRDNLAAIAATLEAMRKIERHGGAQILERAFTGFTALPKPSGPEWWEVLQVPRTVTRATIEAKFRELARDRHPDRGGSDHQMAELNHARDTALKEIAA